MIILKVDNFDYFKLIIMAFILILAFLLYMHIRSRRIPYCDYVLDSDGKVIFGIYQFQNRYYIRNFNTKITVHFKTYHEVKVFIENWGNWDFMSNKKNNI